MTDRVRKDMAGSTPPFEAARLGNPLDFLCEAHAREREVCALLDRLAVAERPDRAAAGRALAFLQHELPLHVADEEDDLFPLLRRRCEPADQIDAVIARLTSDHREVGGCAPEILGHLHQIEDGGPRLLDDARAALARYAAQTRYHLIFENAVILPFARLRLTKRDLESLRLRMLQRRGYEPNTEVQDAL